MFSLAGKVALVTGGNNGIGYATALALAKLDAKVYIACRSAERGNEAVESIKKTTNNGEIHFIQLDLNDLNSVDECAEEYGKRENKLDILINNAGMIASSITGRSKQGIEQAFAVNYLGHFLLTLQLLKFLHKGAPSRVINLSSLTHSSARIDFNSLEYWKLLIEEGADIHKEPLWTCSSMTPSLNSLYAQTKLAMLLFSNELSNRFSHLGINSNAICPGVVATNILQEFGFFIREVGPYAMKLITVVGYGVTADTAAKTPAMLCSPAYQNVTGKYFTHQKEKQPGKVAKDVVGAVRLWNISMTLSQAKTRVNDFDNLMALAKPANLSGLDPKVKPSYSLPIDFTNYIILTLILIVIFVVVYLFLLR